MLAMKSILHSTISQNLLTAIQHFQGLKINFAFVILEIFLGPSGLPGVAANRTAGKLQTSPG